MGAGRGLGGPLLAFALAASGCAPQPERRWVVAADLLAPWQEVRAEVPPVGFERDLAVESGQLAVRGNQAAEVSDPGGAPVRLVLLRDVGPGGAEISFEVRPIVSRRVVVALTPKAQGARRLELVVEAGGDASLEEVTPGAGASEPHRQELAAFRLKPAERLRCRVSASAAALALRLNGNSRSFPGLALPPAPARWSVEVQGPAGEATRLRALRLASPGDEERAVLLFDPSAPLSPPEQAYLNRRHAVDRAYLDPARRRLAKVDEVREGKTGRVSPALLGVAGSRFAFSVKPGSGARLRAGYGVTAAGARQSRTARLRFVAAARTAAGESVLFEREVAAGPGRFEVDAPLPPVAADEALEVELRIEAARGVEPGATAGLWVGPRSGPRSGDPACRTSWWSPPTPCAPTPCPRARRPTSPPSPARPSPSRTRPPSPPGRCRPTCR